VRIDDILVHPRDNDLIVGTHGRSIWIIDDITPLQQMADATTAEVHLFDVRPATRWQNDIMKASGLGGASYFRGQNPPGGTAISYLLKSPPSTDVKMTISNMRGEVVREIAGTKNAGINRVQWNLSPNPRPGAGRGGRGGGGGGRGGGRGPQFVNDDAVEAGSYVVKLLIGDKVVAQRAVLVEEDSLVDSR
jgi:hypothetical protein